MSAADPTYQGGRRSRGGLAVGRLQHRHSIIVVVTVTVITMSLYLGNLAVTGILALIAIPVLGLAVLPFGAANKTVAERAAARLRFDTAGTTSAWADDVLSEIPRGENLPGVLAPLMPIEVEDGRGGHQCLLWNRRTGIVSAPLFVSPVGLTLADDEDALTWVTNFGGMLADLGHMPTVDSMVFTSESAPTGGMNQRAYTKNRIERATQRAHEAAALNGTDPAPPPEVCVRLLSGLVAQSRAQTADVTCLVTINFDLTKADPKPKTLAQGAAEVVNMLPRFESALAASGMTVTNRATKGQVIRYLRTAFDPALRTADLDETSEEWEWRDAGPLRTEASVDVYAHDSGYSVSWVYSQPLGGLRRFRGLIPLVSPGRYHRRFSLVYRPYSAAEAAEQVEKEVTAGVFRRIWSQKTKKDETQREHDDRVAARRQAQQESLGAGLGQFTFYVTTTVRNEATLSEACADVERRMGETKTKWRRARRAMEATFAASLGLGIDPTSSLSRISKDRWGA
ncbi:SCO6880 family protein [Gordonia rubripertincta]|uniref:SCO6880 family protein n=1 Tax=Gordonia rubripertincta TaxID=36822 RepID=UPI000B8D990A|nr:SCO6880 family protein [Gordonia rubripertincta]ASR05612.1 hypothetical protein GCWB2_24205 [Gordonia rubripertincta]